MSLAASLRGLGHEVVFLSTAHPENDETSGAFVPSLVSHETRDQLSTMRRLAVLRNAMWNEQAARAMIRLARAFRPDVVHAHLLYPQLSVAPLVVAHRAGLPIVQTLHDYQFVSASPYDSTGACLDRHEMRPSYRALNSGTFLVRRHVHTRIVDQWIAVSEFVAHVHLRRNVRATVVRNFSDIRESGPVRDFDEREGLLFLGALSVEKGIHDVIRLARQLGDTQVVVAGRGPLSSAVLREAKLLPNLEFKGHLNSDASAEAIRRARLLLVPSHWEEPGPLVSLEAMASGTPIVAYSRGGLGEYVSRSGAGVAVRADWRSLSEACHEILSDRVRWLQYSQAGLRASRSEFSQEAHVQAVLSIYQRAMTGPSSSPPASVAGSQ
jgi:glycosyltransferase involved in cell wall biosynthesis